MLHQSIRFHIICLCLHVYIYKHTKRDNEKETRKYLQTQGNFGSETEVLFVEHMLSILTI